MAEAECIISFDLDSKWLKGVVASEGKDGILATEDATATIGADG